jgi:hypothetical protein
MARVRATRRWWTVAALTRSARDPRRTIPAVDKPRTYVSTTARRTAVASRLQSVFAGNTSRNHTMRTDHDSLSLTTLSFDDLAGVTGGTGNTGITGGIKGINNKVPRAHRVGNVKVFGPKTLDDMYWESKPF